MQGERQVEGHHLALPCPPSEMVLRVITPPLLPVRAGTLGEVGWACGSWDQARPVLALLPSVGFDLGGGIQTFCLCRLTGVGRSSLIGHCHSQRTHWCAGLDSRDSEPSDAQI